MIAVSSNMHLENKMNNRKLLVFICLLFLFCNKVFSQIAKDKQPINKIMAYYTHLPFNDQGFTGKYADIIVKLEGKGEFILSREFSYQPYWKPIAGSIQMVNRIIERKGNGTGQQPDKNNVSSNAAIVERSDTLIKIHLRYAVDLTQQSFTNFSNAYNQVGNPSVFYSEYADEYFTIHINGIVIREIRKGTYKLADWQNPANTIIEKITLTKNGFLVTKLPSPKASLNSKIKGESIKISALEAALLYWPMNEGINQNTLENVSKTTLPVNGVNAYWKKGVSGTCLSFDSYSNSIVLPSSKVPIINKELSIEAWIAPQEYPFNDAAIIDHLKNNRGYFIGISAKGELIIKIANGDSTQRIKSSVIPLYKWSHLAISLSKDNELVIYINGKRATIFSNVLPIKDAENTSISVGMTYNERQYPAGAERDITRSFQTNVVLSGLLDEVKIYNRVISSTEFALAYAALKPTNIQPLEPWYLPVAQNANKGFGANYTQIKYAKEWDGLWRVGNYADIEVNFENSPWRYVFWRGTRYLPSLVTGKDNKAIWSSDQSPEHFNGQCYEHMSDMQCRFSNIRLIHNSAARVVVHWRNASASIGYLWPKQNSAGWGIWTDEYWSIYPDGIAVRHQVLHNGADAKIIEMNQNEILLHPGQSPIDALLDNSVIVGDTIGNLQKYYRSGKNAENNNKRFKTYTNLQYINLKSNTKQFQIGEPGMSIDIELYKDNYWNGWNHYPIQLIPSDGTTAFQYDRPSSTCPVTFREIGHQLDAETTEAMTLYGLTNRKPEDLIGLNRFWNYTPELTNIKGANNKGFSKQERAYQLDVYDSSISFTIDANEKQPLFNPVFIIRNWNKTKTTQITVNGKMLIAKKDYQQGVEIDTNGKQQLVVWLQIETNKKIDLAIK